jgi:gamma-glutamylcyclotransferase (GGCT)/AIG2-like uncharacterized protein YtfP
MYIGTYGTLMKGQQRHHVLDESKFIGVYRLRSYEVIMVDTGAGFPAAIVVGEGYMRYLADEYTGWWEEYKQTHPLMLEPSGRTGWEHGLDQPLLEVYDISATVTATIDAIEGVPHMYNRSKTPLHLVGANRTTQCTTKSAFKKTLRVDTAEMLPAQRLDDDFISDFNPPNYANVYYMDKTTDWLQGCPIIWNGDWKNPVTFKDKTFQYNDWLGLVKARQKAEREGMIFIDEQVEDNAPMPEVAGMWE